ncbi:MAG: acetylornithine/N-succinyldiaminopimelate aminotransferase [bacterium]|jgi:acetylornithine/N-succinyldiaminopimelate aminotransferase
MSENQSTESYLKKFKDVMVPNYAPIPLIPKKAEGSVIWDCEGKDFIDFAGGIAVLTLGHNHPKLVSALNEQANTMWHISNYCTNMPALELAETLCKRTFAERIFFANSGTEANEAALKLARRYAVDHYGEEKDEIISFHKSFHGRSLFTVSVGGQPAYKKGFGPLPEKIVHAELNSFEDIREKISSKTCAVILEPIMAEGGIHTASVDFVKELRKLCDQNNALLIFDEVQTGVGRTGELFAYQGLGVTPDILTSAKALGGGFPISAMLTTEKIAKVLVPGTHGSTFGGNALGCAVAQAVLNEVNDELLQGVLEKRKLFEKLLNQINEKYQVFSEIRGKGLLIGAALKPELHGEAGNIMGVLLKEQVFVLVAGADVIRFTPSLVISTKDIEEGMSRFEKGIEAYLAQRS